MNFWHIPEIELLGVYERGVANGERVVFRMLQSADMAQFCVIVGPTKMDGEIRRIAPLVDQFFWFGPGQVDANDLIYLYTGAGEYRKTVVQGTEIPAHVIYWGRVTTLFARSEVVPAIIRLGGISIGEPPKDVLQIPFPPRVTSSKS